ncbi:hypothetical protein SAMN03159476_00392 [Pseudomonas sp. NFPP05]|uniref:hypothetical protein n=1 Tax=unclassified Pseudomonas TaxID=196821 RepID=UPI00087F2020|nr:MULTISPECIES: hypothetical protein [unclassified Pseudomonas]SDA11175.1 hypothetical protein SAMN03159465_00392 [Pseudomonas sp. NFPP12]SFM12229.1 hypothetical protein SAMN03159476_00392 [Pseudomonas sp. NFPP05]
MDQTLEELRAENAAAEAAAKPVPQTDDPVAEEVAAAGTTPTDDLAEGREGEEGQQAEPEAWMKGDDQESQGADKKFTDSDIGAAKAKLRAKLEKQHQSELEELRAQLEKQRSESVPQQLPTRPKREDFYDKDDPDEAYIDALADWKVKEGLAQQHANSQQYEQQRKQLEAQQKISSSVDQHYERAAVLAAASGISTELYQSADRRVREAVQGVFGGESGEHITNALIASLGEGSEKVLYNLGVSPKRLNELTSKLAQDPSGIQASIYLGRLSAELTSPPRKTSNAPAPAASVLGDANTTDAGKALQRKYLEAHKRGDVQAAFNIRSEAKAAKINVNSW